MNNFCIFHIRRKKNYTEIMQQKEKNEYWNLDRTRGSIFVEKWVWNSIWVQIIRLQELLVISIPKFQSRIKVGSVFTQFSSNSRDFPIAVFGGLNHACSYGGIWVWMKRFFNIGSVSSILGLPGLQQKTISIMIKSTRLPKNQRLRT